MMTLVLMAVVFLLFLKVLWNLWLPYWALMRKVRGEKSASQRISLMVFLEVGLLLIACAVSFVGGPFAWPLNPAGLLVCGSALVLGSYLHMAVFARVARMFVKGSPRLER